MLRKLALTTLVLTLAACGGDGGSDTADAGTDSSSTADAGTISISPLAPVDVLVGSTLQLSLSANNPSGAALNWSVTSPDLPAFDSATQLNGSPTGAEFFWTPLPSHVGTHTLSFEARAASGESASAVVEVSVGASADSAPVFLRPGPGGTFDLEIDPCVRVSIEVGDDDSEEVVIATQGPLPEGGTLFATGPKSAEFEWCPSPDQVDSSLRWTLVFTATDEVHEPALRTWTAVLRVPVKEGCEGSAPIIEILSPAKGEVVSTNDRFNVSVRATDAEGIREAPLLYYTTDETTNEDAPDLTRFELVECERAASDWTCSIPGSVVPRGEERVIYALASVTDNDDPNGTACDKRSDSDVLRFVGSRSEEIVLAGVCELCETDDECASGLCAQVAGVPVCIAPCTESCTSCSEVASTAGAVVDACGSPGIDCELVEVCDNDEFEPNDTRDDAFLLEEGVVGTICPDDVDVFGILALPGDALAVEISGFSHADGDLDLFLSSENGQILGVSAGVSDTETITLCSDSEQILYATVEGFDGSSNDYVLEARLSDMPCCVDDEEEPNDSDAEATAIEDGIFEGLICPDDDDWWAFELTEDSLVEVILVFEFESIDLDLELYDVEGRLVGVSETLGEESITTDVLGPGDYFIRVYGFEGDSGEYIGEVIAVGDE